MIEVAVRQAASLALSWPGDPEWPSMMAMIHDALAPLRDETAGSLARCCATLRAKDSYELAAHYVDTFDRGRRRTLHMTYYTDGDTRNRGASLARIRDLYRSCGWDADPAELPDHLPAMLEFAARCPAQGERLLHEHQAGLELLYAALRKYGTPYADVVGAVCATLGPASPLVGRRVLQLAQSGPPAESVGLDGFGATASAGTVVAGAGARTGARINDTAGEPGGGTGTGVERQGSRR